MKRRRQTTIGDCSSVVRITSGAAAHTADDLQAHTNALQSECESTVLDALRTLSSIHPHISIEQLRDSGLGSAVRHVSRSDRWPKASRMASQLLEHLKSNVEHQNRAKFRRTDSSSDDSHSEFGRHDGHKHLLNALCCESASSPISSASVVHDVARRVEAAANAQSRWRESCSSTNGSSSSSTNNGAYASHVQNISDAIRQNQSLRAALLCGDKEAEAAVCDSSLHDLAHRDFVTW